MYSTRMASLAVLLLALPGTGLSQAPPPLEPGSRVRVHAEGAGQSWVVGELMELSEDSLRLRTRDSTGTVNVSSRSVARLEVSRGQGSRLGQGMAIGAAVGAVAGLVIGVVTYEECTGFCPAPDPGQTGTGLLAAAMGG
jgi:hypothetical protein